MKKWIPVFLLVTLILSAACTAAGEQVITLTALGDTLFGSNDIVSTKEYAFQRYIEQYGEDYPYKELQSLIGQDDITLVNLENVFNDDAPASKSRYAFRGRVSYAALLTANSIEAVNLANNHSGDYGQAGYDTTVAALKNHGILFSGSTPEGNNTAIWEKDGVKIGFVGVIPLYYKDHAEEVKENFEALKAAGCQVIVASVHAGMEYRATHGDMQERYGRILRSLGAHIIIGHHPHVPQGVSVIDGVTHLYSLGNGAFGGNTGVDEKIHNISSIAAQFALHFKDGVYQGHQLTIWPIHISGTEPHNNYQPVLVDGETARKVMARVQKDSRVKLNPYMDGEGAVQAFVPWEQ